MSVNNPINIFLYKPNVFSYVFLSLNIYENLEYMLASIGLKSTGKKFTTPFNPFFFHIIDMT